MVGFYGVPVSITWQMLIVLIKHSDSTTPALHDSMVCLTAKKRQTERLPEERNIKNLKVAEIDKGC